MNITQIKKYNAIKNNVSEFKPFKNNKLLSSGSKNKSELEVAGRDVLYRAIKIIMDNIGILERNLFYKDIKLDSLEIAKS